MKTGSGMQKLVEGVELHTHTHTQHADPTSLLLLIQNKDNNLKSTKFVILVLIAFLFRLNFPTSLSKCFMMIFTLVFIRIMYCC
jgi:hypothetical protein